MKKEYIEYVLIEYNINVGFNSQCTENTMSRTDIQLVRPLEENKSEETA